MCKFESSQKDESRWQSTDSSKAYKNTSAFKCQMSQSEISDVADRLPKVKHKKSYNNVESLQKTDIVSKWVLYVSGHL